jgi:hypothetical protein
MLKREMTARSADPVGDLASIRLAEAGRFAAWITPWLTTVRIPLLAFLLGAVARDSIWWVCGGIGVILSVPSPLRVLLIPVALATYFLSPHTLFACFLIALALTPCLDSEADYLHVKGQVNALTSDLLSDRTGYVIEELALPPDFDKSFGAYARAQRIMDGLKKLRERTGYPSQRVLRLFRFGLSDGEKTTGAAAAFPIAVYSSLVFVRGTLDALNDAQRLQLYHELGHGTVAGRDMLLRGLRWQIMRKFETPMHFVIALLCGLASPTRYVWVAWAFFCGAAWARSSGANFTIRLSSAANEVLADSFALTHADFIKEGKWKDRAASLAKRLEDEGTLLKRDDPRAFVVYMRGAWLRKWLELGEVQAVVPYDIDFRLHLAFPLYAFCGFFSHLVDSRPAAILFWAITLVAILAFVRSLVTVARIPSLVMTLDSAISLTLAKSSRDIARMAGAMPTP